MDDMSAFERLLADESLRIVGPSSTVDDLAVFQATVAATSPKWRFQSLFSATKFVVAGAIVAVFGGLLLASVLTTQPGEDQFPAAAATPSASPVAATDEAATNRLGAFSPAGSLADGRTYHTATLLPDGRVLVVGGRGTDPYFLEQAEIWDPATATFEPAGSLATGRLGHSATLLPDGRVLIVGGCCGGERYGDSLASAEVWDPATESFEPAGSLAERRAQHTATLLSDGRILILGGYHSGQGSARMSEIWDPVTASFEQAGSFAGRRVYHTATLLPDGRVLIVGGSGDRSEDSNIAPVGVWDPAASSFEQAGSLGRDRWGHTATLLPDGRVLVVGGSDRRTSAEAWDPVTASFGWAGGVAEGRIYHTAALLPDGRVLVVGGQGDDFLASAEVWDPPSASFSPAGALAEERAGHTVTTLGDGRVLVVGGEGDSEPISMAEVWESGDG